MLNHKTRTLGWTRYHRRVPLGMPPLAAGKSIWNNEVIWVITSIISFMYTVSLQCKCVYKSNWGMKVHSSLTNDVPPTHLIHIWIHWITLLLMPLNQRFCNVEFPDSDDLSLVGRKYCWTLLVLGWPLKFYRSKALNDWKIQCKNIAI